MKRVLVLLPDSPYADWIIKIASNLQKIDFDFVCLSHKGHNAKSLRIKYMPVDTAEFNGFFRNSHRFDRIVIHYHTRETGYLVEKYDIASSKIVWILWSGDLYNTDFYKNPLYFQENSEWINTNIEKPKKKFITTQLGIRLKEKLKSIIGKANLYDYEKSFQRIQYIGTTFKNDVKEATNTFGKCYTLIPHSILSVHELFDSDSFDSIKSTGHKLLLGHSGSLENNHLDAISFLKNIDFDNHIFCPLSYGNPAYIQEVLSAGKLAFGEKIQFLLEFIPKLDYYKLLSDLGFAVFFLRIQQAFGNILGLLFLGVKIFLPKENSIFIDLTSKGFIVFALEDISKDSLNNLLSENERARNRDLTLKYYNDQTVREGYQRIYADPLNSLG